MPALVPSDNQMKSQTGTPRAWHRPSPGELPPLPGPPPPGQSATLEEYQLSAATHKPKPERKHKHEPGRDLQQNRADRQYEWGGYYDWYHRNSDTPGSPSSHRRYNLYVYPPPSSRSRYHPSFVPPHYPPTPYNEYVSHYPPSVSVPYRPNGGLMSGLHSPVLPDVDPEGAEVDGSPVATRIVSIVQDTMARLADVLSASSPMRGSESRSISRREKSSGALGMGLVSADAGGDARQEVGNGDGKLVKLEDVLGEIQLLKEDHK